MKIKIIFWSYLKHFISLFLLLSLFLLFLSLSLSLSLSLYTHTHTRIHTRNMLELDAINNYRMLKNFIAFYI